MPEATLIKSLLALIRVRESGTCPDSLALDRASRVRIMGAPCMARGNAEFFSVAARSSREA
jgi:hypothetical protein